MFSLSDVKSLNESVAQRRYELNQEVISRSIPSVLDKMFKTINKDLIMQRLSEVCANYKNTWELRVPIYGYKGIGPVESNSWVTLEHVINNDKVLYMLDEAFNGEYPRNIYHFRVTIRNMISPQYGWREIMLNYYPEGVPRKLIRIDPDMPPLDSGDHDDLPPSPIPVMNPEDDDDRSIHNDTCCCRDCQ